MQNSKELVLNCTRILHYNS